MQTLNEHPAYAAALARLGELTDELDTLVAREVELRATPEPGGNAIDALLSREPDHRVKAELTAVSERITRLREATRLLKIEADSEAQRAADEVCAEALPALRENTRKQLEAFRHLIELADARRALVGQYHAKTGNRAASLERWPNVVSARTEDCDSGFWLAVAEAERLGLVKAGALGKPPTPDQTERWRFPFLHGAA